MKSVDIIMSNTESINVPNRVLVFSSQTAKTLLRDTIGWGRYDFPRSRKEQGGWLIGRHFSDDHGCIMKSEVLYILEAQTDVREPGYIEWSALEDIRLQRAFFEIRRTLAETDPDAAQNIELIGWWHTHPNRLSVFLSSTDQSTICTKFNKPGHYSVVLNPHRKIWRVFAGPDAVEIHGFMPLCMEAETKVRVKVNKKHKECWNQRKHKLQMQKQKRKQKRKG